MRKTHLKTTYILYMIEPEFSLKTCKMLTSNVDVTGKEDLQENVT